MSFGATLGDFGRDIAQPAHALTDNPIFLSFFRPLAWSGAEKTGKKPILALQEQTNNTDVVTGCRYLRFRCLCADLVSIIRATVDAIRCTVHRGTSVIDTTNNISHPY
eukprot:scaffold272158_cov33-Prasinocladus_malaysianus.AAC.1